MSATITVRYSRQEFDKQRQSYDLKIEALSAVDMSAKIFIFQRKVLSAMDSEANRELDQFISIADPVDLEEIPEDAPDLAEGIPYLRKNSVLLRFRSMAELEATYDAIDEDVTGLIAALKSAEDIIVMEDKVYA